MQQRTPEEYKAAYEHHRKAGNDAKAARVAQLYRDHMAQQPKPKDGAFEGFGDAFKRGIDQPLENFGTTAKVLGAENLGQSLQDAVDAPPGQSASAQFMNADKDGSFAWRYLPKAAVEQSGQFAGSLLTRAGGAAAGGAVAGPGGAIAGGLAGPMLFEAVQQLGPIALERAKNNGRTEPNAEDFIYAAGTSAGVGALNAIAPGASGKIKRMLLEGLTEGTQSVGEQTGSTINTQKGLEVDPRQALAEGIIGGSSAGMVDASISTVSAATNLVRGSGKKKDSEMSDADTEAQASLAQRLSNIATANNYDLKDIDRTSTKGARETVDKAHVQYTEELKQLFKDLKDRVKVTDADSLSEVQNKILAEAAYREGRNKTKNTVGAEEMAALDKLAGDTYEGQQAMSLLRQMNQLTEIHNDGYKGGASRVTDQFAPFGLGGEGYDSSRANAEQVLRPLITGGLASATGGASLIPQAAAYGTGRMIDKITGNRSKVNSFVSDNVGNEGIKVGSHPNPESLRERRREEAQAAQEAELAAQAAAEQRAAEEREANLARVQAGAPPLMGSPEDVFRDGTGLDRSGLAQVIRILKSNPNTRAATRRAIEAYETSIATGGRVDFSLIRDINALVDQYPQLKQLQVRPRNQGAATQAVQQQLSQQDANYQRGIENNKAFAQQLQDALAEDNSVLPIHKAHLGEALNQMQLDLGAAPVKRLKAIEDRLAEKGVPTEAAAKYFGPYVERVVAQQEAKADRDATAAALDEDPINDARIVPVPRGNERMQQIFGVTDPGEGGNYIDLDSKEDLTGNTYTGGVVKIIDGKPLLETNDAPAAPASKDSGNKVKVNLFKQKAGWKWIDYDGPETIVSTHQGSKHHYSLSSDFETPVTLQTYPKQPSEPRLRPTSQGKVVLGNKIGSISVRGKVHPVYDQVTIVDKRVDKPKSERMKDAEAAGYDTSTVYYHGTASDIASFEKGKRGLSTGSTSAQNGFWFSDSPETARSYAHHSGTYAPVHNLVKEAEDADAVYGSEKIDQETMLVLDELITSVGIDANGFEKDSDGNPIPVSGYDAYDKLLDTAEKLELKFNSGDRNNGQNIIPIYPPRDADLLVKDMKGKSFNDEGVSPEINDLMRKAKLTGKKGVKLLNLNDSAGIAEDPSNHIAIFEPSNIRSVNAQFDPAKKDSDKIVDSKTPVLTTEDQVNNSVEAAFARVQRDYLEPTPAEIKEKLPEAEDLVQFTIGKKGSSYEDGITSEADIRRIADLLNISISIVNEKGAVPGVISEDSRGNYAGKNSGTTGLVNVRGPKVVGKSQYIATLLHEVSHGLEGQTLDGEKAGFDYAPSPHPKGSKKYNADHFRHGSFREHMHYVLKLAKGDDIYGDYQPDVSHLTLPDYDEAKEIRKEIDAIQSDGTAMRFTGFAPGSIDTDNLKVRPPVENYIDDEAKRAAAILSGQTSGPEFDARFKKSKTGLMKNVGRPFIRYTKDVAEFSVDPLIVYLQDPQMMKLIAPTTSKYIQKVYNKANMPVKFYSSPLVAVMAILLAGLAKGIGGEEEEQQPGALSMQPGLLTT